MNVSPVNHSDVQGLVRFGYGRMIDACYLLVNVRQAAAARQWLAIAPVTTAVTFNPPTKTALQIAFTRQGLEALRVPPNVIAGFSAEFIAGMASDENRSRRLGDVANNSPAKWRWGNADTVPHAVVMLFAEAGLLDSWKDSIKSQCWSAAFQEIECLTTSDMKGREPFGFVDGISQPEIDWHETRKVPINCYERKYSNLVSLGEFLLGYRNEYGKYTDRPLLDSQDPSALDLPFAEDQPGKKDLGRNGTYLVMRQLTQDVRGFWQFLDWVSNSKPEERYKLGSLMVGRAFGDGSPLVPLSREAIPGITEQYNGIQQNQFTYDSDIDGTRCPYGAHIRRANPRSPDIPGDPKGLISTLIRTLGFGNRNIREDLIASTRFHRILRRGREYGRKITPEEALQPAPPADGETGLHFFAINSNIQRQFEFIQAAWLMSTKFDGMMEESDPLLGNRAPAIGCPFTNTFSVLQSGGIRKRIMGLPQFINVQGGAYFFLPGISALRYLGKLHD
jgi:deferrochelatase/peroxidase EfeB